MKSKLLLFSSLLLVMLSPRSQAATAGEKYQPGDTLATFTTKDQHDKTYNYSAGVRLVLVTFAMNPGKAANAFLEKHPAEFLDQHHAIFLSSIYGMPGFVRSFVLSKMKKYPHRVLLADSKDSLERFPRQEDKITALRLDGTGTISAIQFVDADKELAEIFESTK